jgi:hypothetical protein
MKLISLKVLFIRQLSLYTESSSKVSVQAGSRISVTQQSPDLLWIPPSLLSNGYRWLFPLGGRSVKLN